MNDIWKQMYKLRMERINKQIELMDEYNKTVYSPKLKELQEKCEEQGHSKSLRYHYNGLGTTFGYCQYCDKIVERESMYDEPLL